MMKHTIGSVVASCLCLFMLGGCGSTQSTASLDDALQHYHAQRFSLARQNALDVRSSATGEARAHASYIAGLSAYRLGHLDDARSDLAAAASTSDSETVGLACAQLGIIELDRNCPNDAARHFERASQCLDGADARQASQHAAMAYQTAGDFQRAQHWARHSATIATSSPAKASGVTLAGRFVLQAGAFQSRTRAERTARELEPVASNMHLGPVRIVRGPTSRGTNLHMVQFGAFHNRAEANRARASLGRLEVIVVPSLQ